MYISINQGRARLEIYFACRSAVEHDGKNGEMGNMVEKLRVETGDGTMADARLLGQNNIKIVRMRGSRRREREITRNGYFVTMGN